MTKTTKSTSAVTAFKEAERGRKPELVEPAGPGPTRGHREEEGGLRGHSVDDETYPWRVVGLGRDGWAVKGYGPDAWWLGKDVYEAHAQARIARLLHPTGRIENNEDGRPCNISGELDSIPERLAGLRFTVSFQGCDGWPYLAHAFQERGGVLEVYSHHENCVSQLAVGILARDPRYTIVIDSQQFRRDKSDRVNDH